LSKKAELAPLTAEVLAACRARFMCERDETQSIGRRYRRQDEIGTPYCVTVDFDSVNDRAVTVRDRDTTVQERVPVDGLVAYLSERIGL
jgi:glycyl-tRNA synthetase